MDCSELRGRLPEVLTGAVAGGVEEHLLRCEPCRREVTEVRRVIELVRAATVAVAPVEPPPFEDVLARVRSRPRMLRRLVARAAVLLVAALAGAAVDRSLHAGAASRTDEKALAAREVARRALSERPGGLGSSLAVLRALSLQPKR